MGDKVVVIYDFDAEPESGELAIKVNEVLTVLRKDVGEGWWEAKNERGEMGLIPESYVSAYEGGEAPPD